MKKAAIATIAVLFFMATIVPLAQAGPKDNLSKGMDNIFYGQVEGPDNLNETGSKGTKAFPECTDGTKDGVERTIARTVGGIWQILTFWYPKESK